MLVQELESQLVRPPFAVRRAVAGRLVKWAFASFAHKLSIPFVYLKTSASSFSIFSVFNLLNFVAASPFPAARGLFCCTVRSAHGNPHYTPESEIHTV